MDILIKGILEYIQSQEQHKQAVLAGGSLRDEILGLTPKDYDIFVPSKSVRDIHELVQSISHEFSVKDVVCKTKVYEKIALKGNPQRLTCVYGMEFEGKLIDIIGTNEENDEDFANEVIGMFDFGINMVYHNGSYLDDTNSYFSHDIQHADMTLINLNGISDLPNAMKRYISLNERYSKRYGRDLRFNSPCLVHNPERTKEVESPYKKKYYNAVPGWTEVNQLQDIWSAPRPAPRPMPIMPPRAEDWETVTMGPLAPATARNNLGISANTHTGTFSDIGAHTHTLGEIMEPDTPEFIPTDEVAW